jgi:hypothetical protein
MICILPSWTDLDANGTLPESVGKCSFGPAEGSRCNVV